MSFQFAWEHRPNTLGLDDRVAVLRDARNCLEVWPAQGFNAYRWQVAGHELLYRNPQFFTENRPTRTGFPILFPFPNRIRDGRFTWAGKPYQLPLGDPSGKNAIHGFAVNRPWRVVEHGADAKKAWITAEFHGSVDAPDASPLWPADYRARMTYRLLDGVLRLEIDVDNPDTKPLPFGIGFHPYFLLAPFGGMQALVGVGAPKLWELVENLPTGKLLDVDAKRDLRGGQNYAHLQLDDVLTNLYPFSYDQEDRIGMLGVLQNPTGARMLTLWASDDFRELVAFTPPHREAVCLEPYTCTTDAINLQQRNIDAGLRVLQPGEHWLGTIEIHLATQ
ncbi:MAG TPA: aldose 1-epimerase [Gemmataceae bacterium]|nr:aldose 1-epimerase [Gemmataceae bacterium]